jgi:HTH-type transcriptional regulator/antitoxin HipB
MIRTERELGAALRQARLRAGLTQAELAARAEVSRAFVVGIEAGNRPGAELQRVLALVRALEHTMTLTPTLETKSFAAALDDLLAGLDDA